MQQILFNHIPKTGGTTLRIILNKVYGIDKVFFINSKDIAESFRKFNNLSKNQRNSYSVISGHGSDLFSELITDPYRISLLRDPISLFLSQYNYLKQSSNSNFQNDVNALSSLDEYIDYAINLGQDNLLTRYFSEANQCLINPDTAIPIMKKEGSSLLKTAKKSLHSYDFLTDLSNFDKGIYCLSNSLEWKSIPIYRPSNISKKDPNMPYLSNENHVRLTKVLKWDIELYKYFKISELDSVSTLQKESISYKVVMYKQHLINFLARIMGKY